MATTLPTPCSAIAEFDDDEDARVLLLEDAPFLAEGSLSLSSNDLPCQYHVLGARCRTIGRRAIDDGEEEEEEEDDDKEASLPPPPPLLTREATAAPPSPNPGEGGVRYRSICWVHCLTRLQEKTVATVERREEDEAVVASAATSAVAAAVAMKSSANIASFNILL